jgi:integrase
LRAGELLGLKVSNIDFLRRLILPRQQADDSTRQLRELKTRRSSSAVPMTDQTVVMVKHYLKNHWRANPDGLLFPNRNDRPRKRELVVKFGLKPILRKFNLPTKGVGLHAFRHGLGTALSNSKISPKTVQQILRHSDIKTTFRYYVHSDTDAQRSALQEIQLVQMCPLVQT